MLKAGWDLSKIESLVGREGVPIFFLEREDKHEKGGDVKMGGCHFFNYFTFRSHLWCVWEK